VKKIIIQILETNCSDYVKEKIKNKQTFIHTKGTFTDDLYFPNENISRQYSQSFKSFKELGLMSKVKAEVNRNLHVLKGKTFNNYDVKYFDYKGIEDSNFEVGEVVTFNDVIEIDISAAYYFAALNLGLLCKETVSKCLDLHKSKRLAILGSIASKKVITEYVNGVAGIPYTRQNHERKNAWNAIVKCVDDAMIECFKIAKKNFLFYYVDGIYLHKNDAIELQIEKELLSSGFEYKKTPLDKLEVARTDKNFLVYVFKKGNETPKKFKVSKTRIKYLILE